MAGAWRNLPRINAWQAINGGFRSVAAGNGNASLGVSAVPLTMAGWFWLPNGTTASDKALMNLHTQASADNFHALSINAGQVSAMSRTTASSSAASTGIKENGRWQYIAGVFNSATDRRLYLNGQINASNTTSRAPTFNNVGLLTNAAVGSNPIGAVMCLPAIWAAALTPVELFALARGAMPWEIRRGALRHCWREFSASTSIAGGISYSARDCIGGHWADASTENGQPGFAIDFLPPQVQARSRMARRYWLVGTSFASRVVTGSGGLTISGAAGLLRTRVRSAAGGLTLSGTANAARARTAAATGGLVFSGTTTAARARAAVASGGLVFSGAAGALRTLVRSAAGGLTLSGTAARAYQALRASSGGLIFSGTTTAARARAAVASGGLTLSGTAARAYQVKVAPSGGLTISGTAGYSTYAGPVTVVRTASGGLTISGTGLVLRRCSVGASGGISFSGTATTGRGSARTASGGVSFGGAAGLNALTHRLASGGFSVAGAAPVTVVASKIPLGGLSVSGSAVVLRYSGRSATGGVLFSGTASPAIVRVRPVSGGVQLSGSSAPARHRVVAASGSLSFGGAATAAKGVTRTGSGALSFSGSAGYATSSSATLPVAASGGISLGGAALLAFHESRRTVAASGGINFSGAAPVTRLYAVGTNVPWRPTTGRLWVPLSDFRPDE